MYIMYSKYNHNKYGHTIELIEYAAPFLRRSFLGLKGLENIEQPDFPGNRVLVSVYNRRIYNMTHCLIL
jgi:hypothetical protein